MDPDSLVLAGYSDMGAYNDMGAVELGRARARRGAPAPRRGGGGYANPAPRRQALAEFQSDAGGLPTDQMLPFPNGSFTSTIAALNLPGAPQRAFQLRRLVIDQARIGATATGLIQVTQLTVGADPQFVATGAIPASMFAFNAVNTVLKPTAARPGILITLALSLTGALTAPDTVVMSAAAIGPSLS